jgi:hypothetical protein
MAGRGCSRVGVVGMEIEAERFLALTAMLAGFVPTTGAAAERDAGAEREAAEDEAVDGA